MLMFGLIFMLLPPTDAKKDKEYDAISNSISILRMTLIFTFIIFGAAMDIHVFQIMGINYLYIFELDPHVKVTHWSLYRVALILFFVQMLAFSMTMMQIKLDNDFTQ